MSIVLLLMLTLVAVLLTSSIVAPLEWVVSVRLPFWLGGIVALVLVSWFVGE